MLTHIHTNIDHCYWLCSETIFVLNKSKRKKEIFYNCLTKCVWFPSVWIASSEDLHSDLCSLCCCCCCCCCCVASVVSDSVRPHRPQPTGLPRPWDSPGKDTGVGCHFLLQWVKVKSEREVAQSCPTLRNPLDCSLPGSSIHGIFQARVLEWCALSMYY